MSVTRVFAADLGASGGKCFAGTFDGDRFAMAEIHRFSHEAVSFFLPGADGAVRERMVWDDVLLYGHILDGLRAYRREAGGALDAIGIDTWGADGHLLDADGEMPGKMYAYRDHRLDAMTEAVRARVGGDRAYAITGIHFMPFNLSNQLRWLVLHRRDLLRPGVRYFPVPSLFCHYLGGGHAVDSTWASVTQLMDARRGEWSRELLEALEIPESILPRIVAPGTAVGELRAELAARLGLSRARLIAVATHDTAAAFAAAPAEHPEDALIISSGTWSLIGKLIPEPVTTPEAMAANMSNEGGIGNIRFLRNCMGTWIAQELRRGWRAADGREMPWEEMDALAAAAPAFAAFIDPDDRGFYNPADMEGTIVAFCGRTGQAPPAGRGAMVRAVYESLAMKYRWVSDTITRITGRPSGVAYIVGGGCRNGMLNQFAADSLNRPVCAGPEEATAVGNIMVQALGLGLIDSIEKARPLIRAAFPLREYAPRDAPAWNRAYARFQALLGR